MKSSQILVILVLFVWKISCSTNTNHSLSSIKTSLTQQSLKSNKTTKLEDLTPIKKSSQQGLLLNLSQKFRPNNNNSNKTQNLTNQASNESKIEQKGQAQRIVEKPEKMQNSTQKVYSQNKKLANLSQSNQTSLQLGQFQANASVDTITTIKENAEKEQQPQTVKLTQNITSKQKEEQAILFQETQDMPSIGNQSNRVQNLTTKQPLQTNEKMQTISSDDTLKQEDYDKQDLATQKAITDNFKMDDIKGSSQFDQIQPILNNSTQQISPSVQKKAESANKTFTNKEEEDQKQPIKKEKSQASLQNQHQNSSSLTNKILDNKTSFSEQNHTKIELNLSSSLSPSPSSIEQQLAALPTLIYPKNLPQIPILPFYYNLPNLTSESSVYEELFSTKQQKISLPNSPQAQNMTQKDNKNASINTLNNATIQKPQQTNQKTNNTFQQQSKIKAKDQKQIKPEQKAKQGEKGQKDLKNVNLQFNKTKNENEGKLKKQVTKKDDNNQTVEKIKQTSPQFLKPKQQKKQEKKDFDKQQNQTKTTSNLLKDSQKSAGSQKQEKTIAEAHKSKVQTKMIEQQDQQTSKKSSTKATTYPHGKQSNRNIRKKFEQQRQIASRASKILSEKNRLRQNKKFEEINESKRHQKFENSLKTNQHFREKSDLLQKETHLNQQKSGQNKKTNQLTKQSINVGKQDQQGLQKKIQEHENNEVIEATNRKISQIKNSNEILQAFGEILILILLLISFVGIFFFCSKAKDQGQIRTGSSARLNESGELQEDDQIEVAERLYQEP